MELSSESSSGQTIATSQTDSCDYTVVELTFEPDSLNGKQIHTW